MRTTLLAAGAAVVLAASACASATAADPDPAPDPHQPADLAVPTDGWRTDFSISDIPLWEIQPSVPRDAIPPLDAPSYEPATAARDWMDGRAPLIALEIDGDARGYPLAIMLWHEIVNDIVGGRPVAVTFCPLCHAALVYDRELDGREHSFGNTGSLRYSDMVMYDRGTESWWQQATGQAIIGRLTGAKLEFLPAQVLSLDAFESAYPDGLVLSRDTGYERPYGDNPFLGYGDVDERPFRFEGAIDGRLSPKERVITVGGPAQDPLAFAYSDLAEAGAVHASHAGEAIVVLWQPGTADSFDDPIIGRGGDIGSAGVYRPTANGQALTFEREADGGIRDHQTGSFWSATGHAVDGPLEGTRLPRVTTGEHFWFSWAAFTPDTRVWQPSSDED